MKKWLRNLVASAMVLTASVGLTGCFKKDSDNKKETYIFVNYDDSYYVGEEFSIIGTKLKITDANGQEKTITVTSDMVKVVPNMNTAGEKKVTILYGGKEYVFTITVSERPIDHKQEMLKKINKFLNKYNSSNNSAVYSDITYDLTARYFTDSVKLEDYQSLLLLSQMFDNNEITNTAYDGILDAIVKGSMNSDVNNIIDAKELKTKLDYLKTLDSLEQTVSNFDYYSYIFGVVLPETDDYYISNVTDYICDTMYITSKVGKAEIKTIVASYYNKIKSMECFNVQDAFIEVLDSVNKYTVDVVIKEVTENVVSKSLDEISHIISDCVYAYYIEFDVLSLDYFADPNAEPVFETGTIATSLIKKQANAYKNLALSIENTIIELAEFDKNQDYKQIILNILQSGIDFTTELIDVNNSLESNSYVFASTFDNEFEVFPNGTHTSIGVGGDVVRYYEPNYEGVLSDYNKAKDYMVEIYDAIETRGVSETIRYYELVEKLVDYYGIEDSYRDAIITAAYQIIDNQNSDEMFIYETLVDNLLFEEDSFYIELAVDYICEYTYIESNAGRIALEESITTYFNKIKNVETFSPYNMFMQIADIINEHTTDDYVRNVTENILTEDKNEVCHTLSELGYMFSVNNSEIVLEENLYDVFQGEELYITSTEASNLIERYSRNQEFVFKNIEDFCLGLHDIFENEEDREIKLKNLMLTTVDNFTKCCEEEISILETLKQNQWVIWDTYGEGYYDYAGNLETYDYYREVSKTIYDTLDVAFNIKDDFEGTINGLIERRKEDIVYLVMESISAITDGGLCEEDELYQEIETLLTNTIDDYINDTIDTEELTSEIDRLINEHAHEDFITISKATQMLILALMYDEEVDYNEIFKDLELPPQIESIDYNILMDKLFNVDTYKMFTFSDVVVDYITDENGDIIGEVLTLDVYVNFDALISSIKGDIRLTLRIDFEGVEDYEDEDRWFNIIDGWFSNIK